MGKKKIPQIVKGIQNYPRAEVDYSYQKAISYSQLSMYLSCKKKWDLQYKQKIFTPNASIHMTFGTAIHETIQHYLDTMYNDSGVAADNIDLEAHFQTAFQETYRKDYKRNKNTHFSDPAEMREFYDDGVKILEHLKKSRNKYFSKRGWWLVGCEIPIFSAVDKRYSNVYYRGFLDIVLYHEPTDSFVIYDIKTSTYSWNDKKKKDEMKTAQLVLYKQFFAEQYGVDPKKIDIEFFIVKRKLYENVEFPQKRIQQFKPASGKNKMSKARNLMVDFVENVFEKNGKYKEQTLAAEPDLFHCKYCPFNGDKCSEGLR